MMSTRRAFLSAGGASAIALSLAACSRSQTKTAETLASGTPIAEPVLNDKQLAEILQRVQTGLAAADKEKSEAKVKEVMSGPGGRLRAAPYRPPTAPGDHTGHHPRTPKKQGGGGGPTRHDSGRLHCRDASARSYLRSRVRTLYPSNASPKVRPRRRRPAGSR